MALAEHYYADGLGGIGASLDDLLDLLARARPAWMRDSLCTEYPAISWFEPADTAAAVAICARCTVAEECGAWARQNGVSDGVWAGVVLDPRRRPQRPTGRVVSDGAPARVLHDDPTALDLLDQAVQGKAGRPTKAETVANSNEVERPNGTTRAAALRRLRSQRPDLHADDDRPPAPASCARCPMAVGKGKTLCKGCERDDAPPS